MRGPSEKQFPISLRAAGVGLRPVIDHIAFRTLHVDKRAEEFIRYGYQHTETIEYGNWFARVYRRPGFPTLFIDQPYPKPRGEGSVIGEWVDRFGDHFPHHIAVLVEDIDAAVERMKEWEVGFAEPIKGHHGGPLRQVFTAAQLRDKIPYTVLELVERHFGFAGFAARQSHDLMESTRRHEELLSEAA
jgi:hypothetical protein